MNSDFNNPETENIARIRLFAWLGISENKSEIINSLPKGYEIHDDFKNDLGLPTKLYALGKLLKYSKSLTINLSYLNKKNDIHFN